MSGPDEAEERGLEKRMMTCIFRGTVLLRCVPGPGSFDIVWLYGLSMSSAFDDDVSLMSFFFGRDPGFGQNLRTLEMQSPTSLPR